MGNFNSFEEVASWKKSRLFNQKIYTVTQGGNFAKDFDLGRQVRRASISISSNIAEGFERNSDKEFIFFCMWQKRPPAKFDPNCTWPLTYITFRKIYSAIF